MTQEEIIRNCENLQDGKQQDPGQTHFKDQCH